MEAQPPSAPAASAASAATAVTAAAPPASSSSPVQVQAPSPGNQPVVNPPPNPATHYPNGLPRSINGLNGDAANGSEPTPPARGSSDSTTPVQPAAPSPTATATPVLAARAVAAVAASTSAPPPAPAPTRTPTLPTIAAKPLKPMVIYTPSQPHPHSQPRQPLQRQPSTGSTHKISIVDPPRAYSRPRSNNPQLPNVSPTQGFPSPRREHHLENPKFTDDLSRLTHAMQQSVPAAVRRVIRDNWEKCLLGSEFHHAFLVSVFSSFSYVSTILPYCSTSLFSYYSSLLLSDTPSFLARFLAVICRLLSPSDVALPKMHSTGFASPGIYHKIYSYLELLVISRGLCIPINFVLFHNIIWRINIYLSCVAPIP